MSIFKKKEVAIPIRNTFPQCSGAPMPRVISDGHKTFLMYYISTGNHSYYNEHLGQITENNVHSLFKLIEQLNKVRVLDKNSKDYIALISFNLCRSFKYGGVNDEALNGHQLYKSGLKPYEMHEVKNSSWINEIKKMNSVHPYYKEEFYYLAKHFIFTFHDDIFECIADNYSVQIYKGKLNAVFEIACEMLSSDNNLSKIKLEGSKAERITKALELAGWVAGRNVDIKNIEECYKNLGIQLTEGAKLFFQEFYGIAGKWYIKHDDIKKSNDFYFDISVDNISSWMEDFKYDNEEYLNVLCIAKEPITFVGEIGYYYPARVWIGESEQIYATHEYDKNVHTFITIIDLIKWELEMVDFDSVLIRV